MAYYPPVVLDGFMEQFDVSGAQNIDAFKDLITLEDIKGHVSTPITIVIGEQDHLLNEYHQTMLEQLSFSNKTIMRIKDGEHVCSGRHSEILLVLQIG